MFDGQLVEGGTRSAYVTVNQQWAVPPAASVTRNTLVVTPTGKADPLANPPVCVVTAPAQLSVPRSEERRAGTVCRSASTLATMFDGQLMIGGSMSVTVTVKLHIVALPAA